VEQSTLILYLLLIIFGGAVGISRYSLEELETGSERKDFRKLYAHFILTAAVSVVGGVLTKYMISDSAEAVIAGGIVIALIGHARVRGNGL